MKNVMDAAAVRLRAATDQDLPAIEAMLRTNGLPRAGVPDFIEDFVLAESGAEIVGAIGLEVHDVFGLLRSAAVASEWQGRGLGTALVERIILNAKARGVQTLYLLTTTAERYFPSFGFSAIGREDVPQALHASAEFRGACPASATVMSLQLA